MNSERGFNPSEIPSHKKKKHNEKSPLDKKLDRRKFMMFGGMAAVGLTASYPILKQGAENLLFEEGLKKEIKKNIEFIRDTYKVELDFSSISETERSKGFDGVELSTAQQSEIAEVIRAELSKYPPRYIINATGLKKIRLLNDISYTDKQGNSSIGGGFSGSEGDFYVLGGNAEAFLGWGRQGNYRSRFHHELFHAADAHSAGVRDDRLGYKNDDEWAALNPDGRSSYLRDWDFGGQPGANRSQKQTRWQKFWDIPLDGFVEMYSMRNEADDRAVLAARMLVSPESIDSMGEDDPIVGAKIKKMKEYFRERSQGLMDEQYWRDLAEGKVSTDYW